MKVFINPGHAMHGNPDPGALNGELGYRESDVVSRIGEKVKLYLERAGCEVRLLQSHNLLGECPDYGPAIVDAAESFGADLFISLHCNAFDTRARGCETLCYDDEEAGGALAMAIHRQLIDTMRDKDGSMPDRGIKERKDLAVLRATSMPAVLCEIAFIDNIQDAALLIVYEDDIARAIARGITDYQVGLAG